jgi:hypothetical protein
MIGKVIPNSVSFLACKVSRFGNWNHNNLPFNEMVRVIRPWRSRVASSCAYKCFQISCQVLSLLLFLCDPAGGSSTFVPSSVLSLVFAWPSRWVLNFSAKFWPFSCLCVAQPVGPQL